MTPSPGIEPRPHWWEESALTTAPSLLPKKKQDIKKSIFQRVSKRLQSKQTELLEAEQEQPLFFSKVQNFKVGLALMLDD